MEMISKIALSKKEKETRRSLCVSPPIEAFIEADSHRGYKRIGGP